MLAWPSRRTLGRSLRASGIVAGLCVSQASHSISPIGGSFGGSESDVLKCFIPNKGKFNNQLLLATDDLLIALGGKPSDAPTVMATCCSFFCSPTCVSELAGGAYA